ncbi:tripartite tricarboxylate transporter substrate binding protein [Bordetella sp. BOR01]|uniref:Bug family tripartite tricarboxylate transporter substrate binding protein n=1 Tax=Bordetella sp. BOR01 TaxID=2854779 RepID=UPI001C474683|nr:tripartite tricarboxylate transporter substrate binding protein [Bordetella sp. BOR01]MBV7486589.1 tripartite tricarboxylate transporter substrate binding protein [Bordetella sp. BOR01]
MQAIRKFMVGAAAATMCAAVWAAQPYPSQPITLVNPYAAGGPADTLGRALARELEKQLGQPVVVENKGGGGAAIGTQIVARARPDGYTLLLGTAAAHIVTPLMQHTPYDGIKDFRFIGIAGNQPNMLVVHPKLGVKSVQELIALARKDPGKLNYGSAGPGSSPHLGAELFRQQAGIELVHIPYKGAAPAINDLVGGQVDMAVLNLAASLQFIKDGRLVPLAYAAKERSPLLPDVPTMAQAGIKDAESASWYSLAAPAGTPDAIIDRLNKAVNAVNRDAAYRDQMTSQGVELWSMTPQQATDFVRKDQQVLTGLVKGAGLVKQ